MKRTAIRSIHAGFTVGMLWLVFSVLAGCVAPHMATVPDTPWHLQPSGAYELEQSKVFFGIGKAAALRNRTLQRVSADNNARQALTVILERFSSELVQAASLDFSDAAHGTNDSGPSLKGLVHQAMQRAIITDHWTDSQQGRLLALCRLDLRDFEAALGAYPELSNLQRSALMANLENVHDQLSQKLHDNQ